MARSTRFGWTQSLSRSYRWPRMLTGIASLTVVVAIAMSCAREESPARPHVILISLDTVRPDHLGCYGYPRETSPNIDAFARESVKFSNAFCQASWTLPSHMSVMTSLYPPVHGVQDENVALSEDATTLAEVFQAGGYETAAFVSWVFVGKSFGFGQGFGEFHELIHRDRLRLASGGGAYRAEEITDRVIEWLDRPHPDPFFLFAHYFDPHMDYVPPPPYARRFDPDYVGPAEGTHAWLIRYITYFPVPPAQISDRDREHVMALYDGEIAYTDAQVGRLLDALDQRVGLDNCLVILMSDHGEEFGDHGSMEGHGWTLYDEVLHVPLLIRLPGARQAGRVVEPPVELLSIGPTALVGAGLAVPDEFQGESLLPLIQSDQSSEQSGLVFAESHRFNIVRRTLRGVRYKLIQTDDTGKNSFGRQIESGVQFFDLDHDPAEQQSRLDPQNPVVGYFERELESFVEKANRRAKRIPQGKAVELSREDRELLRSLGYLR